MPDTPPPYVPAPYPRPQRMPGIEMLRLVAAVFVLLLHMRANFGGSRWLTKGYLGVDFFVMLSGFLMALTQERKLAAGASAWRFMARRWWRLWPVVAAGMVLGAPLAWVRARGIGEFAIAAGLNGLLLPVWWRPFVFPLNIPAWTIFAELVMNLLHVTGLWRLGQRALWVAMPPLVLATGWAAQVVGARIGAPFGTLDLGARPETFWAGGLRVLMAYCIGILLSRWWRQRGGMGVVRLTACAALPGAALALAALAVLLAAGWMPRWSGWPGDMLFVLVGCPALIVAATRLRHGHRLAAVAGPLAFPLFALQMPILEGVRHLGGPWWLATALCGAAGMAMAAAPVGFKMWRAARHANTPPVIIM